jgi:hypothetical protein
MVANASAAVTVGLDDFALFTNAAQGFLLLLLNVPIIAVILFQRMLRQQKEYIIMAGLAFTDVLVAFGLVISGIMRSILVHNDIGKLELLPYLFE